MFKVGDTVIVNNPDEVSKDWDLGNKVFVIKGMDDYNGRRLINRNIPNNLVIYSSEVRHATPEEILAAKLLGQYLP